MPIFFVGSSVVMQQQQDQVALHTNTLLSALLSSPIMKRSSTEGSHFLLSLRRGLQRDCHELIGFVSILIPVVV